MILCAARRILAVLIKISRHEILHSRILREISCFEILHFEIRCRKKPRLFFKIYRRKKRSRRLKKFHSLSLKFSLNLIPNPRAAVKFGPHAAMKFNPRAAAKFSALIYTPSPQDLRSPAQTDRFCNAQIRKAARSSSLASLDPSAKISRNRA